MNPFRPLITVLVMSLGSSLAQPAPQPLPTDTPISATFEAPRHADGGLVNLTLRVSTSSNTPYEISSSRDNRQECSFGPLVRVLRVGTREVVYPPAEGTTEPKLCAQDMNIQELAMGKPLAYERTLNLGAGEYMVEAWLVAQVDGGELTKIPAQPRRVSVK